jgi:glycosyltransferase involved in cell wall biosynthesis
MVHVRYMHAGGEDVAFAEDCDLLRANGHEVRELVLSNEPLQRMPRLEAAATTVWSERGRKLVADTAHAHAADIVHFHNTFPLLSPSVYSAARGAGAAVVQTLHNYRLVCPGALLMRNGAPCEACLGKNPWRSFVHRCYRDSTAASATVAVMLTAHRMRGTWRNEVDAYICLTEFARAKLISGGLPADKLHVKGNSVRAIAGAAPRERKYFLYAGRLSSEKGVDFLVRAWKQARIPHRLLVVGDGPLDAAVRAEAGGNVEILGRRSREDVLALLEEAIGVIVPSFCYESFPLVIPEGFSRGVPVIGSALGSLANIVDDGENGLLIPPGDIEALTNAVATIAQPDAWPAFSRNALNAFTTRFTSDINYQTLRAIYEAALAQRGVAVPA